VEKSYSTLGGQEECKKFWYESQKERDYQKEVNMEENTILKWILEI
jgi:hypothetical protein